MQDLFMEPSKMRSEELCNQGSSSHKQWYYAARQHVLPLMVICAAQHESTRVLSWECDVFIYRVLYVFMNAIGKVKVEM